MIVFRTEAPEGLIGEVLISELETAGFKVNALSLYPEENEILVELDDSASDTSDAPDADPIEEAKAQAEKAKMIIVAHDGPAAQRAQEQAVEEQQAAVEADWQLVSDNQKPLESRFEALLRLTLNK